MKETARRWRRGPGKGPFVRGAVVLALAGMLLPSPGRAQNSSVVRRAIAQTCGELPDPKTEAVVAGVVVDSISGVALPDAEVRLSWKGATNGKRGSRNTKTTAGGFFVFCKVPANVTALLSAHLRVTRGSDLEIAEPGELYIQDVLLPVSTTTDPGVLVGRVVDAQTRTPLVGATVRLVERGDVTATNDHGYFSFGKQPFGIYMLEVKMMGYKVRKAPVRVAGDFTQEAEIDLSQEPIELPGLNVMVRPRNQRFDLDGMVRRMTLGIGSFITRDVLEKRPRARITDLLRDTPGISVFVNRDRSYTLEVQGRACAPDVFIDGVYYIDSDNSLDIPSAADLEAIEIYKGVSEIPAVYLRPSPQKPPCAVIAAWTRVHPGAGRGLGGASDNR
jgi:hypothetical protein